MFNEKTERDGQYESTADTTQGRATGYRVDDDEQTEEKDLKANPLFGAGTMKDQTSAGMEGQGMGGHNFGNEGNLTPTGDDKDNPSQNAHYRNAYFARTEPLIEDTANNNFKAAGQEGSPDYDNAHSEPNTPGPLELPDQLKVGEDDNNPSTDTDNSPAPAYHAPELEEPQPDHGSGTTETGEDKDHIET